MPVFDSTMLICTDLDRTLLPNGFQPESASARPRFRALAAHPDVRVAYVTGRHHALVDQAIAEFDIPVPDFLIGDVGTSIYHVEGRAWQPQQAWQDVIAASWGGRDGAALHAIIADIDGLLEQEPSKQGPFKLSYYTPEDWERPARLAEIDARFRQAGIAANLFWSLDEHAGTGLLDVLPAAASKLSAVQWLIGQMGLAAERTVCAGDSGNDLEMLTGPINAVLVANAAPDVRAEAASLAEAAGLADRLYVATGDFHGMNGCYAAGILEGVAHYLPQSVGLWEDIRA
ncbi:HAD-IIB family hydrolase [Thiohalocapsa sp. ML1]|uniref:HAD-IIB family hydrolase n=1 Tax=Thiohalocapsa sp. ML1 TaxID=1431688 RepID=UPI00156D5DEC|nr:HAD-IIB family hydrolase [Thiohalocapsa sp. ML1]